jgi:CPA1 family monovalent cation:H+ antiporter
LRVTDGVQLIVLFLAVLAGVAVLARRLRVGPSLLLIVAGVAIALIPGVPNAELPPELVDLGLFPPILYSAGVSMSWREFKFNLRPISLLSVGCVALTAGSVALVAHSVLQWPWPISLLLGAVVSPPDGLSDFILPRDVAIPRRIRVVSEGEGLASSATALVLLRFALGAVVVGVFSPLETAETFAVMVPAEIAYGIGIGWLGLRLRRRLAEPRVELVLSLITPYVAYWVPAYLGGSGVLSAVAAGLYVSWRGPLLISAATRVQGIFFWDLFAYVVEGFVFLFTGLEARAVLASATAVSLAEVGVLVAATVVVIGLVRIVWVFAFAYIPRWLVPQIARRDPVPPWQWLLVLSLAGVRGVVPLAAALAIPPMLASGVPLPERDVILVVTYGVIIVTLFLTATLLPAIVRALGLEQVAKAEQLAVQEAERGARLEAFGIARKRLAEIASDGQIPLEVSAQLSEHHDDVGRQLPKAAADGSDQSRLHKAIRLELIQSQRDHLHQMLREGRLTDESRRRIERDLDFEAITLAASDDGKR